VIICIIAAISIPSIDDWGLSEDVCSKTLFVDGTTGVSLGGINSDSMGFVGAGLVIDLFL
jgi:hypothetical protein